MKAPLQGNLPRTMTRQAGYTNPKANKYSNKFNVATKHVVYKTVSPRSPSLHLEARASQVFCARCAHSYEFIGTPTGQLAKNPDKASGVYKPRRQQISTTQNMYVLCEGTPTGQPAKSRDTAGGVCKPRRQRAAIVLHQQFVRRGLPEA